jgi:predicted nucleic acid-binding protein
MKSVFADTLYWVARTRPDDPWGEAAKRARDALGPVRLVTTDEVLTEFLAALSKGGEALRKAAVEMVRVILRDPNVKVIPQTRDSFLKALDRYAARQDKEYSLTDCSSMNAMDAEGIREILTNDHHFAQDGYVVLVSKQTG